MLSLTPPPILRITPTPALSLAAPPALSLAVPPALRVGQPPYFSVPVSPRPSSLARPTPMCYPLPHLLRFLGTNLQNVETHKRECVKAYALALMRRDHADALAPVLQDAEYCEQVYIGARHTLRLLATHALRDEHYQNMRIA